MKLHPNGLRWQRQPRRQGLPMQAEVGGEGGDMADSWGKQQQGTMVPGQTEQSQGLPSTRVHQPQRTLWQHPSSIHGPRGSVPQGATPVVLHLLGLGMETGAGMPSEAEAPMVTSPACARPVGDLDQSKGSLSCQWTLSST